MSAQAKGLTLRLATREDAPEIAALLNLISRDLNTTLETAAEVTQWFDLPRLQTLVARAPDGTLVGYADLQSASDENAKFALDVRVHPEHPTASAPILTELERLATAVAAPGASLRAYVPASEAALTASLSSAGYQAIRQSFTMEIELQDVPEAELPVRCDAQDVCAR